jgi:hypothetical protein
VEAREDERQGWAVFATNLWEVVKRSLAQEKKKKEENELAMSSRAHSVTHLVRLPTSRVPFVCSPIPAEKGEPTSLRRGEGLAAVVPSRREREREKREAEAEVVVGEKRASIQRHTW